MTVGVHFGQICSAGGNLPSTSRVPSALWLSRSVQASVASAGDSLTATALSVSATNRLPVTLLVVAKNAFCGIAHLRPVEPSRRHNPTTLELVRPG